jgi:hypothetical protein
MSAAWYKPNKARLFHAFLNGVSLCGAWKITQPLRPLKTIAERNGRCGDCLMKYILNLTCLCKDGDGGKSPKCPLHGKNPIVPVSS